MLLGFCRISRAIDIMLLHVDNMKKIHDREHSELEESKKYVELQMLRLLLCWQVKMS